MKHIGMVVVVMWLALNSASPQDKIKPVLIDEVNTDHCENLLSRLDSFTALLANANSKGFVLFNTTTDKIRDNFLYRFLQLHRSTRSGQEPRYEIIPTSREGAPLFQMWSGSPDPDAAKSPMNYELDLAANQKVFFASELFEPFTQAGKLTFSEVGSGCSTRPLYLGLLSLFLDKNPGTKAYFVFRGTRKRFDQLKKYLVAQSGEELMGKSAGSRMRYLYAGTRMINNKQFVEVEVFISRLETKSAATFPYNLGTY